MTLAEAVERITALRDETRVAYFAALLGDPHGQIVNAARDVAFAEVLEILRGVTA